VFSLDDICTAGNGNSCDEVVVPSRAESHISKDDTGVTVIGACKLQLLQPVKLKLSRAQLACLRSCTRSCGGHSGL
jgi:hypothetical protein